MISKNWGNFTQKKKINEIYIRGKKKPQMFPIFLLKNKKIC
jgi:hypothetical protein